MMPEAQPNKHLIVQADDLGMCNSWTEQNRTSDLRTLLDPEIKARIEALGIELVSVGNA